MTTATVALPLAAPVPVLLPDPPTLPAVLRRLGTTLLIACVLPAALFYVVVSSQGLRAAVITALAWSAGATVWRCVTGRRLCAMLLLSVLLLCIRTGFALATGSAWLYFMQPVVTDALMAGVFLASLLTARPLAGRLATDFYPLSAEVADRPVVRRLFRRLTVLWAGVYVVKSLVGLWLVEHVSVADLVLVKTVTVTSLALLATAVTVLAARVVLRRVALDAAFSD